jgi:hypothetical protein
VVKGKPMDLRLCRKKLGVMGKHKKYKNFFKDLQRIWDNCKKYHPKTSLIHRHAEVLEKFSRKCILKFKKQVGMRSSSSDDRKR